MSTVPLFSVGPVHTYKLAAQPESDKRPPLGSILEPGPPSLFWKKRKIRSWFDKLDQVLSIVMMRQHNQMDEEKNWLTVRSPPPLHLQNRQQIVHDSWKSVIEGCFLFQQNKFALHISTKQITIKTILKCNQEKNNSWSCLHWNNHVVSKLFYLEIIRCSLKR